MAVGLFKNGIEPGRLAPGQYTDNFSDLHPPLDRHEAFVEADRCYFCFDAPCMNACPTSIDIPMFIREISTDNPLGAAETIFEQNILGGMCARVCPTEQLCEEACVRMEAEGKPVKIGQLQRYATDIAMEENKQFFTRAPATGKKIAVVGAGPRRAARLRPPSPAGWTQCAHWCGGARWWTKRAARTPRPGRRPALLPLGPDPLASDSVNPDVPERYGDGIPPTCS